MTSPTKPVKQMGPPVVGVPWDFGHHEALHSAWIVMESFDKFVATHYKVDKEGNAELKAQIEKTQDELYKTYSMIGSMADW